MKTELIQIGNSRGIRIPKAIIEQCDLEGKLELDVHDGALIIRPLAPSPRAGWEEAFKNAPQNQLIVGEES